MQKLKLHAPSNYIGGRSRIWFFVLKPFLQGRAWWHYSLQELGSFPQSSSFFQCSPFCTAPHVSNILATQIKRGRAWGGCRISLAEVRCIHRASSPCNIGCWGDRYTEVRVTINTQRQSYDILIPFGEWNSECRPAHTWEAIGYYLPVKARSICLSISFLSHGFKADVFVLKQKRSVWGWERAGYICIQIGFEWDNGCSQTAAELDQMNVRINVVIISFTMI